MKKENATIELSSAVKFILYSLFRKFGYTYHPHTIIMPMIITTVKTEIGGIAIGLQFIEASALDESYWEQEREFLEPIKNIPFLFTPIVMDDQFSDEDTDMVTKAIISDIVNYSQRFYPELLRVAKAYFLTRESEMANSGDDFSIECMPKIVDSARIIDGKVEFMDPIILDLPAIMEEQAKEELDSENLDVTKLAELAYRDSNTK